MTNSTNSTNNTTKDTKDNVMFYLASAPIMCRHAEEDQCQWGQFVDIESNSPFVPVNAKCYTTCSTIKETSEEIPECVEVWFNDPANAGCSTTPPRSILCSQIEVLGTFVLSILRAFTFITPPTLANIDNVIANPTNTITSTAEQPPL